MKYFPNEYHYDDINLLKFNIIFNERKLNHNTLFTKYVGNNNNLVFANNMCFYD